MRDTQAPLTKVWSMEGRDKLFWGPSSPPHLMDSLLTLASTWMASLLPESLPEPSRLSQVPPSGSYDTQLLSFLA